MRNARTRARGVGTTPLGVRRKRELSGKMGGCGNGRRRMRRSLGLRGVPTGWWCVGGGCVRRESYAGNRRRRWMSGRGHDGAGGEVGAAGCRTPHHDRHGSPGLGRGRRSLSTDAGRAIWSPWVVPATAWHVVIDPGHPPPPGCLAPAHPPGSASAAGHGSSCGDPLPQCAQLDGHYHLAKRVFDDYQHLLDAGAEAWQRLTPDLLKSLCACDYIPRDPMR